MSLTEAVEMEDGMKCVEGELVEDLWLIHSLFNQTINFMIIKANHSMVLLCFQCLQIAFI